MARGGGQIADARQRGPEPQAPIWTQLLSAALQTAGQIPMEMQRQQAQQTQNAYMQALLEQQQQGAAQKQAALSAAPGAVNAQLATIQGNPNLAGAVDPMTQGKIDHYGNVRSQYLSDLGDARVGPEQFDAGERRMQATAAGLSGDLDPIAQRGFKAQKYREIGGLLDYLPPEQREIQRKVIEAAAKMAEAGVNDQAIDGILQQTAPNVKAVVDIQRQQEEIKKLQSDSEADAVATPMLLRALGTFNPDQAESLNALASVPGLVLWGAGSQFMKLLSGREESALFAGNEATRHGNAMTEIKARGESFAGGGGGGSRLSGIDPVRTVLETGINRFVYGAQQGQPFEGDLPSAIQGVFEELKIAAPGLFTPAVEAQLKGFDPQVLTDYSSYRARGATQKDWPEIEKLLRTNGRTPQQVAATKRLLMDSFVHTGPARVTR